MSYLPKREYICNYCGHLFKRYGNRTYNYCSIKCKNLGQQKREKVICVNCSKEFERTKSHIKWASERGYKNIFCSHKCRNKYQMGENHPAWTGGKIKNDKGYIKILAPNHPKNIYGYYFEHRIIMEKHIGRYLESNEDVHHINGIKDDNRIENLEILTDSNHSKLTYQTIKHKLSKRKMSKEHYKINWIMLNNKI